MSVQPTVQDMAPRVLPAEWHPIASIPLGHGNLGLRWLRTKRPLMTVVMSVDPYDEGGLWWHLSVAHPDRLPSWKEVVESKELFMGPEVPAMHMIPPRSKWLSVHPFALHLWHRLDGETMPRELYV